jgi:hypothetical protein
LSSSTGVGFCVVFKLEDVVKSSLRNVIAVWIFLVVQCSDGNGFLEWDVVEWSH